MIPDEQYARFLEQATSLPTKKQRKWKGCLLDRQGVKSRLRFHNHQIENYSQIQGGGNGWCVVAPERELSTTTIEPLSPFWVWSESQKTTAPHLTMADKVGMWKRKVQEESNDHTDPRKKGMGKHGECSYTWIKTRTQLDFQQPNFTFPNST